MMLSIGILIILISLLALLFDDILPVFIKPIAILAIVISSGYIGYSISTIRVEKAMATLQLKLAEKETQAVQVNEIIVEKLVPTIKYVERIKVVKVLEYIPAAVDTPVNQGLVVLHDSIVNEVEPAVPSNVNDYTGIKLSDVAEVVKQNYATCLDNSKRLSLLQEWVIEQGRIYK